MTLLPPAAGATWPAGPGRGPRTGGRGAAPRPWSGWPPPPPPARGAGRPGATGAARSGGAAGAWRPLWSWSSRRPGPARPARAGRAADARRGGGGGDPRRGAGIEDLREKREEINKNIGSDEQEKAKIQNDLAILTKRLSQLNDKLARQVRPARGGGAGCIPRQRGSAPPATPHPHPTVAGNPPPAIAPRRWDTEFPAPRFPAVRRRPAPPPLPSRRGAWRNP